MHTWRYQVLGQWMGALPATVCLIAALPVLLSLSLSGFVATTTLISCTALLGWYMNGFVYSEIGMTIARHNNIVAWLVLITTRLAATLLGLVLTLFAFQALPGWWGVCLAIIVASSFSLSACLLMDFFLAPFEAVIMFVKGKKPAEELL